MNKTELVGSCRKKAKSFFFPFALPTNLQVACRLLPCKKTLWSLAENLKLVFQVKRPTNLRRIFKTNATRQKVENVG